MILFNSKCGYSIISMNVINEYMCSLESVCLGCNLQIISHRRSSYRIKIRCYFKRYHTDFKLQYMLFM